MREKSHKNRRIILENTRKQNQYLKSSLSGTSCTKTDDGSTELGSDIESDKTGRSKVLHWLKSLPKDHKGIRNAKKIGKCSVIEKPRWNI